VVWQLHRPLESSETEQDQPSCPGFPGKSIKERKNSRLLDAKAGSTLKCIKIESGEGDRESI
jgi:hypothetical protein